MHFYIFLWTYLHYGFQSQVTKAVLNIHFLSNPEYVWTCRTMASPVRFVVPLEPSFADFEDMSVIKSLISESSLNKLHFWYSKIQYNKSVKIYCDSIID